VLADAVGVKTNEVLIEMERMTGAPGTGPSAERAPARVPPHQKVEREALKLMIQAPQLCEPGITEIALERFATPAYQKVFDLVRVTPAAGLVSRAQERGESIQKLVAGLSVEPLASGGDPTADYAHHVFLRLEEFELSRKIDAARKELERLNPLKAQDEYDRLFEQLVALEGARRRIRVAAEAVGSST